MSIPEIEARRSKIGPNKATPSICDLQSSELSRSPACPRLQYRREERLPREHSAGNYLRLRRVTTALLPWSRARHCRIATFPGRVIARNLQQCWTSPRHQLVESGQRLQSRDTTCHRALSCKSYELPDVLSANFLSLQMS